MAADSQDPSLRINIKQPDGTPFRGTVNVQCQHQTLSDRHELRAVDASKTIEIRGLKRTPQGLYRVTATSTEVFAPESQFVNIPASGSATVEFVLKSKNQGETNQLAIAEQQLKELIVLKEAEQEFELRVPRFKPLQLLDYRPSDPQSEHVLVPPGSITLFLGRPGSQTLASIRQVVTGSNAAQSGGQDLELGRELKGIFSKRNMLSFREAVEVLRSQPVMTHLQYGHLTVAKNLFVPEDLEVAVVPLPYNGGELADNTFQLLLAPQPGSDAELEGLMVRHAPTLTSAEAEAIRLIPSHQSNFNVGHAAMCYAITGVALVGAVIAATYACPGGWPDRHLDDAVIQAIGPQASARQLLNLRRQILEKSGL